MPISRQEFKNAVQNCGFPPPDGDVYRYFASTTQGFSRNELAMFLAQLIHESGGFQYREEIAYVGRKHHNDYVDEVGRSNKTYHGRGFIQLTWARNYRDASRDLGMGNHLLDHPEEVAEDTELAMKVSVWYWKERVRPQLQGRENWFGLTTDAINGAIECRGRNEDRARRRYDFYLEVARALNISNIASERGCYN